MFNILVIINFQANTLEMAESILEYAFTYDITSMLPHNHHKKLDYLDKRYGLL